MKFTSKQLTNVIGLKEEDVVICQDKKYIVKDNKLVCKDEQDEIGLEIILGVDYLLDKDFEIIPRKKKIGDLFCSTIECVDCPLCVINCKGFGDDTLYEQLKKSVAFSDSELYDILKARLDKEVEE